MRTIKFRVWNDKTKSWIHGPNSRPDLDGINLFGENVLLGNLLNGVSIEDLNEIHTLQYTGLKDKNGKSIFEGDVIRIQTSDDPEDLQWELLQVCFISGKFALFNEGILDFENFIVSSDRTKADVEIVGNIFENPDLIK